VYPQGNSPDQWPQYDQQPYQQDPYGQPQSSPPYQPSSPPYEAAPYQSAPYQPAPYQPASYQPAPYQQPAGYPGQPFPGPATPRSSGGKTALIVVGAVVGALVLLCGAGVLVVALSPSSSTDTGSNVAGSATASPTASATAGSTPTQATTPTAEPSTDDLEGDIDRYKEGDCLTITGADNTVKPAKCTDAGAYKVLLRREGVDATTRQAVCDPVEATTDILYVDAVGTSEDLILCIGAAK
jgi:hypothetical protein